MASPIWKARWSAGNAARTMRPARSRTCSPARPSGAATSSPSRVNSAAVRPANAQIHQLVFPLHEDKAAFMH